MVWFIEQIHTTKKAFFGSKAGENQRKEIICVAITYINLYIGYVETYLLSTYHALPLKEYVYVLACMYLLHSANIP